MLRDDLNNALPGRLADAAQSVQLGEILNMLLTGGDVVVPALTSTQNATTVASAPSAGYVQAEAVTTANLANALKISYNALQVDVAALRTALLSAAGVTEAAVTVTANVATLANQPKALLAVVGTTETGTTHMKKLLRGPITGPGALVPTAGQAVWDGAKKVLFATADVVTVAAFLYTKATDATISSFQRDIGEQD